MPITLSNNNLITKATTNYQSKQDEKIQQNIPRPEATTDKFVSTNPTIKRTKAQLIASCVSGIVLVGLFFLPEILMLKKAKKLNNALEQAANFKPLIGEINHQSQQYLNNGRIKTTLESIKNGFKYNEILIIKNGKPNKRILMKKEKLDNGKYILREMKVYEGEEILDNAKLEKNVKKCLKKHYKRTSLNDDEYIVAIKTPTKETKSKYFCTSEGEPILKSQEYNDHKENTLYLYSGNTCVGTDTQIVPKDSSKDSYNIATVPKDGIFKLKYTPNSTNTPYDKALKEKFIRNF